MSFSSTAVRVFALLVLFSFVICTSSALAGLYINEIYFDPPGSSGDTAFEYIELRGTPSMSLANTYLVFLENEDTPAHDGEAGQIDAIWDLGTYSMGSNGFLVGLQKGHSGSYFNPANFPAGTTALENTSGAGTFGWGGAASTIHFLDADNAGKIENSGFTAMLINKGAGVTPVLNMDLDVGNNGLDNPNGQAGWTIIDSIGVHGDIEGTPESVDGRLYAKVNFGGGPSTRIEPGASYVNTTYEDGSPLELEYVGRWGNSTGQTPADWVAINMTDKSFPGGLDPTPFDSAKNNFAVSADPTGSPIHYPPQAWHGNVQQALPTGQDISDTMGATNHGFSPATDGDYDDNGTVDSADIDILWHIIRGTATDPGSDDSADLNGDGVVNEDDLDTELASKLTAGPGRHYGDADLVGGVGPDDFTAWRIGGSGWAHGDFDGTGDVGPDDFTLWRTAPTTYPSDVGPRPGDALAAVPEPASWLLAALGVLGVCSSRWRR